MNELHLKKTNSYNSLIYKAEGLCIGLELRRLNKISDKKHKREINILNRIIEEEIVKTKFELK